MSRISLQVVGFFVSITTLATLLSPLGVEAATKKKKVVSRKGIAAYLYNPRRTYKDEKVDPKNPASRCNTPAMRALHVQNVKRAQKDAEAIGVTSSTQSVLGEAFRAYEKDLTLAWGAMTEPYCGYGAFGISAARKSYDKSVARLRQRFLDKVKHELKRKPEPIAKAK